MSGLNTKRATHSAAVVHDVFTAYIKKHCHRQTNKQKPSYTPDLVDALLWDQILCLCLSELEDDNRPWTLFVIDDSAATFHLWPPGAALAPSLTSWDSCNDTGIHLMTLGQEKGQWWKVKSRCPTAIATSRGDWIGWLSEWTLNLNERQCRLDICYQRLQVCTAQRSFRGCFLFLTWVRSGENRQRDKDRGPEQQM